MSLMWRAAFVVAGVVIGSTAINYFVLGNSADYATQNARIGAWREAMVRPACYRALEQPEKDHGAPRRPPMPNRVGAMDLDRTIELTAALHCYLITQNNAVCERNNRAWIVDYIRKYFGKMDEMLATAAAYDRDEVRIVHDVWNAANNRAIVAALDNHIRNGRLTKADFGWTVPAQLKAQLDRHAGAPDTCTKERPWVAVKL
jgi:hypothetical protein